MVKKIGLWIVGHPWQITTGMLAFALGAVLVLDGGDPNVTTTTSTSTTAGVTTTEGPSEPGATVTTSTTAAPVGEGTNPFTGEPGVGGNLVVVKVDNAPAARPQIGLAPAGLIIEVLVEGGLTRFTALYLNQFPNLVGPVRSLRPVDADLLAPFPGTVIATGGQRHVVGSVAATGNLVADPQITGLLQALERPTPHHLFASIENAPSGVPLGESPPWLYGDWVGGDPATSISIALGVETAEWRWDGAAWLRYSGGAPTDVLDEVGGSVNALGRETVIVLSVNQKSAGYTDSEGADVPDFDVVGGGELWILHNGEVVEGAWSRQTQVDPWIFTTSEGDGLLVPRGPLCLVVMPTGSSFTISP